MIPSLFPLLESSLPSTSTQHLVSYLFPACDTYRIPPTPGPSLRLQVSSPPVPVQPCTAHQPLTAPKRAPIVVLEAQRPHFPPEAIKKPPWGGGKR